MTATWTDAATVELNGLRVNLSTPRPVHRSHGYCWFPSCFTYGDGRLAAMMSCYADIHVTAASAYITHSGDGGLTWTEPVVAVDGGFDGVLQPNGDLLILPYYLRPRPEGMYSPYNLLSADTGLVTYKSEGVRVSGWPYPDRSYAQELGTCGFVFNGQTVALQDGGWLMTLYGYFEGYERLSLVCAESQDAVNWTIRSVIALGDVAFDGGDGPSEAALLRQADGRLLCVFRLGSFVPYGQCWSEDDGRTWSPVRLMDGPFSVQPSLARQGELIALSGGRPGIFLWLNPAGDALAWQGVDLLAHHNACVPGEPIQDANFTTAYTEVVAWDDDQFLILYDRIPWGWAPIPVDADASNSVWIVRATVQR